MLTPQTAATAPRSSVSDAWQSGCEARQCADSHRVPAFPSIARVAAPNSEVAVAMEMGRAPAQQRWAGVWRWQILRWQWLWEKILKLLNPVLENYSKA